ncbi:MAG: class I SAM-dependent methyltransferase [Pseudomonadota bacterium]
MEEPFDEKEYWIKRHDKYRGDPRSVGNLSRTVEQNDVAQLNGRKLIRGVVPKLMPRSALDLACGVGRVAPDIIDLGFEYTGVDVSPTAIEQAKATYPEGSFVVGDITTYQPTQKFDLVMALHVLVHLVEDKDWENALDVVAGALKPGGLFLLIDELPEESKRINVHVMTRSRETYKEALAARGLKITDELAHNPPKHTHPIRHI